MILKSLYDSVALLKIYGGEIPKDKYPKKAVTRAPLIDGPSVLSLTLSVQKKVLFIRSSKKNLLEAMCSPT